MYKCSPHGFRSDNPTEIREHKANFDHAHYVVGGCNKCGAPQRLIITGKQATKTPIVTCQPCKDKEIATPQVQWERSGEGGESQ